MVPTPSLEYSSSSKAPSKRASTRWALFTPFWQAAQAAMSGRGRPDTYHFSKSIVPEPVFVSALSVCLTSWPAHMCQYVLGVCHFEQCTALHLLQATYHCMACNASDLRRSVLTRLFRLSTLVCCTVHSCYTTCHMHLQHHNVRPRCNASVQEVCSTDMMPMLLLPDTPTKVLLRHKAGSQTSIVVS